MTYCKLKLILKIAVSLQLEFCPVNYKLPIEHSSNSATALWIFRTLLENLKISAHSTHLIVSIFFSKFNHCITIISSLSCLNHHSLNILFLYISNFNYIYISRAISLAYPFQPRRPGLSRAKVGCLLKAVTLAAEHRYQAGAPMRSAHVVRRSTEVPFAL